jgi:hypothetical protein
MCLCSCLCLLTFVCGHALLLVPAVDALGNLGELRLPEGEWGAGETQEAVSRQQTADRAAEQSSIPLLCLHRYALLVTSPLPFPHTCIRPYPNFPYITHTLHPIPYTLYIPYTYPIPYTIYHIPYTPLHAPEVLDLLTLVGGIHPPLHLPRDGGVYVPQRLVDHLGLIRVYVCVVEMGVNI